jgi:hypothetical protein
MTPNLDEPTRVPPQDDPDPGPPNGGKPTRDRHSRGAVATGLALIVIGAFLLAIQWVPGFDLWVSWEDSWPLIVIGIAVLLAVIGLVTQESDMAIPASIVGGIGGLLFYQNATGDWGSWAYSWALIPAFVGVGLVLAALLGGLSLRSNRVKLGEGFTQIVIGAVLFGIFGAFLDGPPWLARYWPVAVILLGVWTILRPRYRGR